MQFVGLDVHKRFTYATVVDKEGNKIIQQKILNTVDNFDKFLSSIDNKASIVMESCSVWQYIYNYIENGGYSVKLAHPLKTRLIAEARIKTDKVDSEILANLLRCKMISESYVPPKYVRIEREIARHRSSLVSMRTQIKNKIHAILAKNGVTYEMTDLFGKSGMEFLRQLDLPGEYRLQLNQYLDLIEIFNKTIDETQKEIEALSKDNPSAMLLTSIPGISYYSALMIMAEIGDIRRFPSAKKLCSYAGLVPSTYQSGDTERHGSITKQGSRWMRKMLIQAANKAVLRDNALRRHYLKLKSKKRT